MNIKNIMMAFLLGAGVSLCTHAEGIDTPAENIYENDILLDWSEEPYMRLIDEYSGGVINVWTSSTTGETIYYVDYPWIVRVPEELEVEDLPYPSIPNAPEVEGGYYLYNGAYLASSPNSALDQVKNELAARKIKDPKVARVRPKKVILTSTLFPGIQFIGLSKGDAEKSKGDYGFDKNPISELTIAVPAKDKETFERAYKKGGFDLVLEKIIAFTYQGSMAVRFNDEIKKDFLKLLTEISGAAEYVGRMEIEKTLIELFLSRQSEFYMDNDMMSKLAQQIINNIENDDMKFVIRTLAEAKVFQDFYNEETGAEKEEFINLWMILKEYEQSHSDAMSEEEKEVMRRMGKLVLSSSIIKEFKIGVSGDIAKHDTVYMKDVVNNNSDEPELREGDEIVITARGFDLVHTNTVRNILKDTYTFIAPQGKGRKYRIFTTIPRLFPDHGFVSTVKLWPNGEESKCENGIVEIDTINGFALVDITYYNGSHEYIRKDQLVPGERKVFGTITLEYNEQKDDNGKVIFINVKVIDLLCNEVWYVVYGKKQAKELEERNR